MERVIVMVLVAALGLVQAGPLKTIPVGGNCARTCTGTDKLNYQVGKTYNYKYDAEIKSSIFDAMEDHAGLHMSANVHMEVLSKCELVMKLDDVSLTEYDTKDKMMKMADREFKDKLEKYPLRVSFQDGNVEEICLLAEEPQWVINAKRGILSLFQNNMADLSKNETLKETDISGTCDTDYYVQDDGYYVTNIGKSKKLHTCTDRHSLHSSIQGIPYTANSEYQSMPILKSEQECQYKIDKQWRHITSVHCVEQHLFRPFSRENSGALTKNDQKLVFIDSTSGTSRSGPAIHIVSLKYNHGSKDDKESKSKRDLVSKLTELCKLTKSGVRPETPQLFTELVRIVKGADVGSLKAVRGMLEKGTICKDNIERTSKFFLDTLPLAGTAAALNLMTTLLTTGEITGVEADMWLTSLAFIKKPDIMTLREVKPLVNMKEDKALLSVGTLIHSYCSYHGNCHDDPTIMALVSAIENKMAPRCKVTDANFKSTLTALRALGNAGHVQSAVPTLNLCMKIKSNPIEIRLSAVDAFRRIPCTVSRNSLIEVLKDIEEDPEIRIVAYKSIMECPSEETLNVVRKVLEKEEIKQVGSYIWSHLTNLMETSDRHKQGIREILIDETFKKEFDFDMMKYSRNYEKSMFIEPINTGGKIEADLIWTPKSLVPRASMLNLTVDLFGQSVNLFELGGRVQGLEYFLEAFYGPHGYFSDVNTKSSDDDNKMAVKSVKPDKIKRIDKRFESEMEDLRASLYMRVFGNELKHYNIRGVDDLVSGSDFNILELINKMAKDNDVTYSHSTMFLGTHIIIPMGSGFPMNLSVDGTASIDMKMNGKMDLKNADIVGAIKPSAAIDITSVMSVDAFVTKCGIKMVSTLHTSTSLQGKIHMSQSGTLLAEYEMPQNKMEVFDFKSSFFTIHRESEKEQKMIEDNRQTKRVCSPGKLVTATGLELCMEISYPNASLLTVGPYFPLTGPVSGGMYLYNRDTHTKYTLHAKSIHTRASNLIHFTFDTPGSKINRLVSLNMDLNKKDSSLEVTLTSPWKKADLQATLVNTKKTKGISGKLNIDSSKSYSIKALVDMESNPKVLYQKYVPRLQITAPGLTPVNIQATLETKQMRVLSVDLDFEGILDNPVEAKFEVKNTIKMKSLTGSLQLQKNKKYSYESSVGITSYGKKRTYKPLISIRTPKAEVMAIGGTVTHTFGKKIGYKLLLDKIVTKKVSLKGNFRVQTYRRARVIYGCNILFTSSPFDMTLISKIDNKKFRTISTDITFNYNLRGVSRNGIKLISKINNLSSSSLTKGKGSLNLNVKRNPEYNFKVNSNIDHNKKLSQVFTDISYGKDFKDKSKQISASFEMERNFKDLLKANANLKTKFRFPALKWNLVLTGKHNQSDRHLDNSFSLKFGPTFAVESDLHLKDNTGKNIELTGDYTLSYPGRNFMIKDSLVQKDDNTFVFSLDLQPQKNEKHTAVTQLNVPSVGKSRWNVFSDINMKNEKTLHLEGTFDLNPSDFITKVSYEKEKRRYVGMVTSKTTEESSNSVSDLVVGVEYPSRHVMLNLNGQKLADKYCGFAALKWDANKDPKQMIHAGFWLEKPTPEKINGSISLKYPTRELKFSLLHQEKAKYLTRVDFQWDKDKTITADTTLSFKDKSILCTGKMTTPFTSLPVVNVKLAHDEDFEQYLTQLDVGYSKAVSFDTELRLKKPLSLKTFVGHFLIQSSLKALKKLRLDFDHKLNPSVEIDSMVKMLWNKQQVQANFELKNITKGRKVGFEGDLKLTTTYSFMKKGILKLSHDNNGYTFNTAGSFKRNQKMYKFNSKITHAPSSKQYETTGKIDMSCPQGSSAMTWDHRLSVNKVRCSTSVEWGKKAMQQIALTMNGNTKDTNLAINLQTPFKATGNVDIDLSMNKDSYPMKASVDIKQNGGKVANALAFFDQGPENLEGKMSLEIPSLNIDSGLFGKHSVDVNKQSVTTDLEAILTPSYIMEINSILEQTQGESYTHVISLQTSLKDFKRVVLYSNELLKERMNTLTSKLEYGSDSIVEIETSYLLDDMDKKVYFTLKTPLENMKSVSLGYNLVGSPERFTADMSVETIPHLKKKTASLTLDTTQGVTAKATLDTIFQQYPQVSVDLNALVDKQSSDVSGSFEYLKGHFLTFKFNHDIASPERKILSARVSSPSTAYGVEFDHTMRDMFVRSDLSLHKDDRKYTGIIVQLDKSSILESSVILSLPTRRDVEFYLTQDGPKTHFEMRHNKKHHISYDMELLSEPSYKLDVTSSWQIEFLCPDEYGSQVTLEFAPRRQLMSANGYFRKSSIGKSEIDILLDAATDIEGRFKVKSPLMKNIKATFNHVNGQRYYNSKGNIIYGGKEIFDGVMTMSLDSSVVGDVIIKSAFTKKLQANIRYDGQLNNFVVKTEGSYGKSSITGELTSHIDMDLLHQKISLSGTELSDMSFEISHFGNIKKFTIFSELNHGADRHRVDLSSEIAIAKIDLSGSIVSPLLSPMSARITGVDSLQLSKGHMEFIRNTDRSDVNMEIKYVSPKLEMSFDITSPYTRDVVLTLEHSSILPDVNTIIKLSVDKLENYDAQVSMETKSFIKSALILNSPTDNFEGHFEHEGTLQNLRCHVEYKLNADSSEIDLHLTSTEKLQGHLSLKSSYIPEDISLDFEHIGSLRRFKSSADYSYGLDRSEIEMSLDIIENMFANVKVTLPNTPVITATFRHTGGLKNLNCHMEYMYGSEQSTGDLRITASNNLVTSSFNLVTPYMEDISMSMRQESDSTRFKSTGDLTIYGQKSEASITLNLKDESKIEITTPGYTLKLAHSGLPDNFQCTFDMSHEMDKYTGAIKVLVGDKVDLSVELTSPITNYETLKASYKHTGKPTNFRCNAELVLPDGRSDGTLIVDIHDISDLSLTFDITPSSRFEMKPMKVEYKFKNKANGIITSLMKLDHGFNENKMTVEYVPSQKLEGIMVVKSVVSSPIRAEVNLDKTSVKLSANSKIFIDDLEKGHLEVSLNTDNKIALVFSTRLPLDNAERVFGDLTIDSAENRVTVIGAINLPIESFSKIDLDSHFIGDRSNFDLKALLKSEEVGMLDLKGVFNSLDKITGDFYLESVANLPLAVVFDIIGTPSDFSFTSELSNNQKKVLTGSGKFFLSDKPLMTSGTLKVNNFNLDYSLDTSNDVVKSHAAFSQGKSLYKVESSFTDERNMDASVTVTIPDKDIMKGTFTQSSQDKRSVTKVLMQLDRDNIYDLDMTLNWWTGLQGELILKTPHENFTQVNVKHEHGDASTLLKSSFELNNNVLFKASAVHQEVDGIKGTIFIATPVHELQNMDISFYHEGSFSNLKCGGNVIYSVDKEMKLEVEHLLSGNVLKARAAFTSIYTNEIVLTAFHSGPPTDFTCKYEMFLGQDDKIITDTMFKTGVTSLEFMSTVSTSISGTSSVQRAGLKLNGELHNFKCEATVEALGSTFELDSSFQSKPIIEGSLKLTTPIKSFEEMKASFSHSGNSRNFLTTADLQYMTKQFVSGELKLVNKGWKRMDTSLTIKTPFEGYKENRIEYEHRQETSSFECKPKLTIGSSVLSGDLKVSKTPISITASAITPFEGLKTMSFEGNLQSDRRGRYSSRLDTRWGQLNQITFDGSVSNINNRLQGSASLISPFDVIRHGSVEFTHQDMPTKYMENLLVTLNRKNIVDLDVDFNLEGVKKHFIANLRAPSPTKVEITGEFTPYCVDMDFLLNTDSKLETRIDLRYPTKIANLKLTRPGESVVFTSEMSKSKGKTELSWGQHAAKRTGFEYKLNKNDAKLIIIVPVEHERVLELNGLANTRTMEGEFLWDAAVDRSKKFGIKTMLNDKTNNMKGDIAVYVPVLKKTIQVESDITVNRGRAIFDGQLSFSFSRDERKKIILLSRVEDVSSGPYSTNYSQPYTTVDVKINSHIGRTDERYSAGIGMEYMTFKGQTKVFSVGGEIDQQRKFMNFEMTSPLKMISIVGKAQTGDNFQVTLENRYDNKRALHTEFSVNPAKRLIAFKTNYDLDNPINEMNIRAEYVNSSALKAEVYRMVNFNKVTDILATSRLNTSHLLHTRLHWRPEIYQEIEDYYHMKMGEYETRAEKTTVLMEERIIEELEEKFIRIINMMRDEFRENDIDSLETSLMPYKHLFISNIKELMQAMKLPAEIPSRANVMKEYQMLSSKAEQPLISLQPSRMMMTPLDKPINYAIDMLKLPAKQLPSRAINALKYAKYVLPEPVNTQIVTINKNFELEERFESMLEAIFEVIKKEVIKDLLKLKKMTNSPITVYDPKHGEIQAEFFLPIPLRSLDVMPVVDFVNFVKMIKEKSLDLSVRVPNMRGEWMPPFTGIASVSQGRQITTFDGLTYELDSDCTFILTRDYRDGNFTIIRSNGDDPSVTILTKGKPLQLKLNGEVYLGEEMAELPISNKELLVTEQDNIITVTGTDFSMTFDLPSDVITVKINGWYFGKTGGLLGIYDNEPSNDHMTSFNKVVANSNRFAKTWEVGTSTCR